jgi:alanyl-tRNA synthetase
VHPDYLRFDFAHFQAVTKDEIRKIESIVNARIRENPPVQTEIEDLEKAIAGGAKAFFDDKYGDQVRVLSVGGFSKELCGGTHAEYLGEAGLFKIVSESSVASGVRRMVAVTGEKAYQVVMEQEALLENLAALLKSPEKELPNRVEKLLKEKSDLQKKISQQMAGGSAGDDKILTKIEGVNAAVGMVEVESVKDLRPISDRYKQKLKSGVVVVGTTVEGKATVIVSVTDDIAAQFGMPKFVDALRVWSVEKAAAKIISLKLAVRKPIN